MENNHNHQQLLQQQQKQKRYRSLDSITTGYRFSPTDKDLILYYLIPRLDKNMMLPSNTIHEDNIYKYSPETLTSKHSSYRLLHNKNEWYFFTPRTRKYLNGSRPNRTAGSGFWKPSINEKEIRDENNHLVGYKMALNFYLGKQTKMGTKTDWKMHEYKIHKEGALPKGKEKLDECVLCKIYLKEKKNG